MVGLKTKELFDVVVIGNGVLGMGIAFQLRQQDPGLSIAVVGPALRPHAASLAAGAMINVWAELAVGQFENAALADRAELGIQAIDLWDAHCQALSEFSEQPLRVNWNTYILNNALGSPHEMRAVDYILDVLRKRNVKHDVVTADSIPWLKPEPHAQISRVVRLPDGHVDSRQVIKAYDSFCAARDIAVFDTTATKIDIGMRLPFGSPEKTISLREGDSLRTKNVVLANGTFAQALVDQLPALKREVPRLLWGAGSALDVSFPDWIHRYGGLERSALEIDAVVRTTDRGGACGLHLVPYGKGEYYVGASSGVWFEPEFKPRLHAVHVLMRSMVEEINYGLFFSTIGLRGPGFRPVAMDAFPLLGQSHIPGIWFANGTKRDGFTTSPYICREIAREMLGGSSSIPRRFLPSRKLISYKTKEQAIDDFEIADIGGETQHGLRLPPYALASYRAAKRQKAVKTYEQRGIERFGIHPELLHLYENDEFFAACDHPREQTN
jgi:glycine/D-amino acid oxidase-like deaminating enzyme